MTEVEICNLALSWLGVDPIATFDDDTTVARWCKLNYAPIRDTVLTEHTWTFAAGRWNAVSTVFDPFNVQYSHAMPFQWLAVYRVYRYIAGSNPNDWPVDNTWRMEGGNILTQYGEAYFWGTQQITDTTLYPAIFIQALAARIAADGCIPFTENRQLQSDMWSLYGVKLRQAASRDGMQGANDKIKSSALINARAGGRSF